MHVFGQHNPPVDFKWMARLHRADDHSLLVDPAREQIIAATLQQINGEEVHAAGMPGAAIIGHDFSIATAYMRRNALRLLRPTSPNDCRRIKRSLD
jgi:hypothetical protein